MITKISENEFRTMYIINLLKFELDTNPNQQIMILAHTKSLINKLFDDLDEKYPGNVGLYIGGMKEEQLKLSESKQIIIATYSMASEGLDIKTLTTLIMATPKSDVCQSVGRILRSKHEKPLVIDILDMHDVFQNQFQKRKQYYHKKEYIIQKYSHYDNYINDVFTTIEKEIQKSLSRNQKQGCLINLS